MSSKELVNNFIKENLVKNGNVYESKFDKSYICHTDDIVIIEEVFLKFGITKEIQSIYKDKKTAACIGFNPLLQKWYGWSHRAVCGFGIGSICDKGDCAYKAKDKYEFLDECYDFWKEDKRGIKTYAEFSVNDKGIEGVLIKWVHLDDNDKEENTLSTFLPFPEQWGKGKWTAKTLEDAKQMAIDFAENVG